MNDPQENIEKLQKSRNPEVSSGEDSKSLWEDWRKSYSNPGEFVHSPEQLHQSRSYVMMLLACYGDDQLKNKVVEKLVDQEIGLQESIRIQGYSSAEIRDRVRKFLAWFIPILFSTFVLGLVIILVGKSAWGWSVDDLAIETLTSLIKWSFGGLVATIVLYYFPSKESLKRLFDRKQQTDVR